MTTKVENAADTMTLEAIEQMARDLMTQHDLLGPGLWVINEWDFKFDRAVNRLGCCHPHKSLITLSAKIMPTLPVDEVRDVILHEIAHALIAEYAWRRCCEWWDEDGVTYDKTHPAWFVYKEAVKIGHGPESRDGRQGRCSS